MDIQVFYQIASMTTRDIAEKLVAFIRAGNINQAQEELLAEKVVCTEPVHGVLQPFTRGKRNIIEKRKQYEAMVKEWHSISCSDPLVTERFFSITMTYDHTLKGLGRRLQEQVCVYEVEDGKIIRERFFY